MLDKDDRNEKEHLRKEREKKIFVFFILLRNIGQGESTNGN